MTRRYIPGIGWLCYGLVWLLLGANMVNDWLTQGWISPLSLLILVCLVSIPLLRRSAGQPGASMRRLRDPPPAPRDCHPLRARTGLSTCV